MPDEEQWAELLAAWGGFGGQAGPGGPLSIVRDPRGMAGRSENELKSANQPYSIFLAN